MRTQRQIEASRLNGAKSRGPVTHAGRQKSSRNSRRHCLYAKDIHVSPSVDTPAPRSANPERDLLRQAVLDALEERMRIVFLETRVMEEEIARQRLIHPAETEVSLQTLAFRRLADETGTMHAFYRFEGAAVRRLNRALEQLSRCPEAPQNENCETNPRIDEPEQAYNRRIATHEETNRDRVVDPVRPDPPSGPSPSPRAHHEAAHAGPHSPRLQRHPPHRQSRRTFG